MKKVIIAILMIILLLSVLKIKCDCLTSNVQTSAKSSIIMESKSHRILNGKNINEQLGMASVTKIMTLIIALENSDLNSVVQVSKRAANTGEASMHLVEGEKITLENLLYGLMLASGNDAAVAISEHISKTTEEFVKLMNQKAAQIGAKKTCFINPHGLTENENYNKTTAYDLAIITSYGLENPKFAQIVKEKTKTIERDGYSTIVNNHNRFLGMYDGANGVKTGYTKKAGRCLVTSVTKNNMQLVAVTLNAPDDWCDHKCMYNYGYENYENKIIAKEGEIFGKVKVINGVEKYISLVSPKNYNFPVKNGENIKVSYCAGKEVKAPVKFGEKIREIKVEINGKESCKFPLICEKEVMLKNDVIKTAEPHFKINFEVLFKTWIFTAK